MVCLGGLLCIVSSITSLVLARGVSHAKPFLKKCRKGFESASLDTCRRQLGTEPDQGMDSGLLASHSARIRDVLLSAPLNDHARHLL